MNSNMNSNGKKDLAAKVAARANVSIPDSEKVISALWDTIIDEIAAGNKVQILGFGIFEQRVRKGKTMKNPRNPDEMIVVPEAKIPVFRAGKKFKDIVNSK